ncbi:MAG TPA: PEGA domain-containing protein, partial [Kofleriaceae bacterium]|nr:PEGA domain-containing protein [Kofleriaceae bacterium]
PVPTIPIDATPPVDEGMAYLIVRTIPDGGTIKVGDQSRHATRQPGDPTGATTAQLVLPPGKHVVTAELAGFQSEQRTVVLAAGDNQRIEITFTKKTTGRPTPMGKLTVRTTPWSDVYLGTRKLGQAPFADLELPVGTHTLTFKNPSRPTVTKTVTIKAGKSVKLNFNL